MLNLDSQPERLAEFRASLATSTLLAGVPLMRWRATLRDELIVPDFWWLGFPNRAHAGSTFATGRDHQAMIERAYADGLSTLLIFEDDARLEPFFDEVYAEAASDLPPTWHALWLTGTQMESPAPFSRGLRVCCGRLQTAAYLLSRRGMHRVFSHLFHEKHLICDQATRNLQKHYATDPAHAGHEPRFFEPARLPVQHIGWRNAL